MLLPMFLTRIEKPQYNRLLGLQMTRSVIKVKFLSTVHPNFRDGLLKGNLDECSEDEPDFHLSAHQYYELRPMISLNKESINYDKQELEEDYWTNLCLAKFWSMYEIVYSKSQPKKDGKKTNLIPLLDYKTCLVVQGNRSIWLESILLHQV